MNDEKKRKFSNVEKFWTFVFILCIPWSIHIGGAIGWTLFAISLYSIVYLIGAWYRGEV